MNEKSAGMRAARWLAVVIIAGVASAAFVLSFAALRGLGVEAHVEARLAWLLPVVVDGTIVLATVGWLVMANQPGHRRYFLGMLAAGAAVSIAGNSLHAIASGHLLPGWACALVAAIAPISLLADTHGLAVLFRVAHKVPAPATVPELAADPAPPAAAARRAPVRRDPGEGRSCGRVAGGRPLVCPDREGVGGLGAHRGQLRPETGRRNPDSGPGRERAGPASGVHAVGACPHGCADDAARPGGRWSPMMAFFVFWGVLAAVTGIGWLATKLPLPSPKNPYAVEQFGPQVAFALHALTDPLFSMQVWHSLGLGSPQVGYPTVHRIDRTPVGVVRGDRAAAGGSISDWRKRVEDIAAALVVPQVRITDLGCGNLLLDLVVFDPLADGFPVPAPVAAVDLEAVEAGLPRTAALWLVPVLYRHLLFAGVAGAGKSRRCGR